jgi:hypothetical protein
MGIVPQRPAPRNKPSWQGLSLHALRITALSLHYRSFDRLDSREYIRRYYPRSTSTPDRAKYAYLGNILEVSSAD